MVGSCGAFITNKRSFILLVKKHEWNNENRTRQTPQD
jgi:hypothetical protein